MAQGSETARVNAIWDRVARVYDKRISFFERRLFQGGREWVCSRARGKTLEIAVGTGRNLGLYGDGVELTGIELSEEMLARARDRAVRLGVGADLRRGDAQSLDHVTREPLDHLRREGFAIDELERLKWGIVDRVSATKPS
ncbi:MAG TPA: class I SAM-dependent methyltransferase [Actinomycetota bacterium]|nr:class I SAM-dependent methyltransferase [Actinomycetota bacterium]